MNTIVRIRIDERLIHGQVALTWAHLLQATRIMVIDNEVWKDSLQITLLKMACPKGVKLSILSAADAGRNLQSGKYEGDRIFILVKKPEILLELWDNGVHMEEVNVGNMSGRQDTVLLKKDVCISRQNIETFQELHRRGVKLTAQTIPNDPELDLMHLLEKIR